jgi:hypothetical protein
MKGCYVSGRASPKMLRISVATICWSDPDRHPRLREAAEHHLGALVAECGLSDQT